MQYCDRSGRRCPAPASQLCVCCYCLCAVLMSRSMDHPSVSFPQGRDTPPGGRVRRKSRGITITKKSGGDSGQRQFVGQVLCAFACFGTKTGRRWHSVHILPSERHSGASGAGVSVGLGIHHPDLRTRFTVIGDSTVAVERWEGVIGGRSLIRTRAPLSCGWFPVERGHSADCSQPGSGG
jgi:hypothetical protein